MPQLAPVVLSCPTLGRAPLRAMSACHVSMACAQRHYSRSRVTGHRVIRVDGTRVSRVLVTVFVMGLWQLIAQSAHQPTSSWGNSMRCVCAACVPEEC